MDIVTGTVRMCRDRHVLDSPNSFGYTQVASKSKFLSATILGNVTKPKVKWLHGILQVLSEATIGVNSHVTDVGS